jgi:hypothetical protein
MAVLEEDSVFPLLIKKEHCIMGGCPDCGSLF